MLRIRIRDSGSGTFLSPGSGMGKKSGSVSGMNDQNHISESLETLFWVKILKNSLMRIRDPGWKKFGSGINIPDPQHCMISSSTYGVDALAQKHANPADPAPDAQHCLNSFKLHKTYYWLHTVPVVWTLWLGTRRVFPILPLLPPGPAAAQHFPPFFTPPNPLHPPHQLALFLPKS